jgi:hypothetical protein
MPCQTTYSDLKEFGLEFVPVEAGQFSPLLQEIQTRQQPGGPQAVVDRVAGAAVLLNKSGKAIVALAYFWKYTLIDNSVRTSHVSNLGTSMQMDVLSGRTEAAGDRFSFILPGSKRLITESGCLAITPISCRLNRHREEAEAQCGVATDRCVTTLTSKKLKLSNSPGCGLLRGWALCGTGRVWPF